MLVGVLGVTWLQRQMLFPRSALPRVGEPERSDLERWWIDSPEGPVEAWFSIGKGVTVGAPGPVVVFAHGNGELIDDWPEMLQRYRDWGVSLLLVEYRGYGRSAGEPSEAAIEWDFHAAVRRLLQHPAVDASRTVYHGRSLGGGAVCLLLARHPPRALILESTFTSVSDVAKASFGVPAFLIADRFDSLRALQNYKGPLLAIHGLRDRVIPVEYARRLAAASARSELALYDCGHNDLPPPGADYWERIETFLQRSGVLEP